MQSLKQKELYIKQEAKKRNLKIKQDKRLTKTPYRAMQPFAGKELDQPYIKNHITYEPKSKKNKGKLLMDLNHEIIEYDLMKKKLPYHKAHKISNKKQRRFPC